MSVLGGPLRCYHSERSCRSSQRRPHTLINITANCSYTLHSFPPSMLVALYTLKLDFPHSSHLIFLDSFHSFEVSSLA